MPGRELSEDLMLMERLMNDHLSAAQVRSELSMGAVSVLPNDPVQVTYIRPCHYCRHKIRLDSRGRCSECGAPEHLAIEPFITFLVVPEGRSQNPGPK